MCLKQDALAGKFLCRSLICIPVNFFFFFVRKATPENPVSTEIKQRFEQFLTAEAGAEGLPLLLSGLKEEGGTSLDFISLDSIHNTDLLPAYTDYDANGVDKGFLLFKHKG
jgi:uncharacterized protein (DUF3820 family)